jgi:ribosome maturation factor RimP
VGKAKKIHTEKRAPRHTKREPAKIIKFDPEAETVEIEEIAEVPMAKEKKGLQVGQRVKFYRTHDGAHQLTGTIEKFHEDSDLVDITTEIDGKAVEVERLETAHVSDVTAAEE